MGTLFGNYVWYICGNLPVMLIILYGCQVYNIQTKNWIYTSKYIDIVASVKIYIVVCAHVCCCELSLHVAAAAAPVLQALVTHHYL